MLGTAILTLMGMLLSAPLGVAQRPVDWRVQACAWLARVIESCMEVVAGTPDIVIALFGLALFELSLMARSPLTPKGGVYTGSSFLAAGAMMSLIALPPIFTATRDGLEAIPGPHARGRLRARQDAHRDDPPGAVPSVRSNMATGVTLGVSRIIGDTAIVVLLLGERCGSKPQGSVPVLGLLRGTGSTLTSYVYDNSPAGEGRRRRRPMPRPFVLLVLVLGLNLIVGGSGAPRPTRRA